MASIAILAALVFFGWLIFRAIKGKPFKAYVVAYAVAVVTGVFTLAFFLSMDIPQLIKIVVSILLGIALIILAAYRQRRQPGKP
ncbi:hypothetical protein ACFLVS_06275 [Chloroflexota bacterium]